MSRILAVWELGAHLGHIDRLLLYARVLRDRGHDVRFVLRDLSRAHARVAADGFRMGQAPVWLPRMANPPRLGNYSLVLAEAGWLDAAGLAGLISGWQACYEMLRPDALLCDHAPTAVLAARGLGIPVWTVGTSFELPPVGAHFPPMAFWEPAAAAHCAAWDASLLAPTQRALQKHGLAPLPRLTALFDGTHRVLTTLPELAHYDGYPSSTDFCGPVFLGDHGARPQWPDASGTRVFAYLSPTHAEFGAVMAALRELPVVALVYANGLTAEAAARLSGPRLRFSLEPLRMDDVLAQCNVVVSHGGLGTTSAALLAGRPQLLLPTHMEQWMVARRTAAAGLGLATAPHVAGGAARDWRALLRQLTEDPRWASAAAALAEHHRGRAPHRTAQGVADRIESSLRGG